ncbi:flippase [Vibrio cyclitrophicus]
MTSTKSAIKNTIWLFGERGAAMLLLLSTNIILARYLSTNQFGQLNYLISFMALLIPFSSLGLNVLITREIHNNVKPIKTILSTALSLRVIGGGIGVILTCLALYFINFKDVIPDYWLIFAAIANIFTAGYLFDFYFQAKVASRYAVKVRLFVLVLSSIAKILAVVFDAELKVFLIFVIFEPVLIGLLFGFAYKLHSNDKSNEWVFDSKYSRQLLQQSRWLVLSGFMAVVYLKVDQIMLGQMLGATSVATYAVAVRLSEVWYFFPAALVGSFFPKLLEAKRNDKGYINQLQNLCDILFWSSVILALVISLSSKYIVGVFFGEEYITASKILNIHIWAAVFIFMRALLSKWLIAEGMLPFSLLSHGIAAVVNVVLNLYLIPLYGGVGAAWATFVSYGCSSYLVLWLNCRTRPMAWIMTKSILFPIRFYSSNNWKFNEK